MGTMIGCSIKHRKLDNVYNCAKLTYSGYEKKAKFFGGIFWWEICATIAMQCNALGH